MSIEYKNCDAPDFVDIPFFERALKNGFGDSTVKIKHVIFTGGTKPGENYCSEIRRATVTYSTQKKDNQSIPLIVKYLGSDPMAKFFKALGIFKREDEMYVEVLPKLKDILNGEDVAPMYFYFEDSTIDTIVFEDVSPKGYQLGNATKGLDERHCELALRKLGRYHAASMVLIQRYPEVFEKFKENVKLPNEPPSDDSPNFLTENFSYLAKIVATWPGFEETAKKIERFVPLIDENYNIWSGPVDDEVKVLAHDDLWTNNILYKYEDNIPTDLFFIDFQIAFFSSPGIDLIHFFYTSPEFHVLEQKRDYMVEKYYYEDFKSILESLSYSPIPSLQDIFDEMRKREIIGFLWSMIQFYVVCIEKDEGLEKNMMALSKPDTAAKLRYAGMTSKRFVDTMKYMLRKMEEVGVLK